ncbi:MAG: ribokinase [Negativicutes bacterium]|jgi:ribokinase
MKKRITVVGSMNMDLVFQVEVNPERGETVFGDAFTTAPGGKGANQAVAAGKLGGECVFVGCCGNDDFGRALLDSMKRGKVDVDNVKVVSNYTGVAGIVVEGCGDNRIIVASGANNAVTVEMVDNCAQQIRDSAILLVQLEVPLAAVIRAIEIAHDAGVTVVLDPAPAKRLPESLFAKVDYLLPNEGELDKLMEQYDLPDVEARIAKLLEWGVGALVITKGGNGCEVHRIDGVNSYPAYCVVAVDTTAAGDTFAGAFATKLSQQATETEAIDFAMAAAALAVTRLGAQTSIPTLSEVNSFRNR